MCGCNIWISLFALLSCGFTTLGANLKPNIVVIIADDLGWNDVSFHGSDQIKTPNIDAIGYHGAFLHRHYAHQVCTPSRAAFLTGQYAMRLGYQGYPMALGLNRSIPHNVATLPKSLKNLGYRTHLVGKWHLGHGKKSSTPLGYGFDTHFGYWNGYIGYFDHAIGADDKYNGTDLHNEYEPVLDKQGQYATDLFTTRAIDIINQHPKDQPIYIQLAHLAAHTGKTINGKTTVLEVHNKTATDEKYSFIADERRRMLAEIIERMDQSVGDVIEALALNNMLENTIIVFFSDNGAPTFGQHSTSGSNHPLRGIKTTMYDGAVRTSSVIFAPMIKNKGKVFEGLFHITDWVPTLYKAAGGDLTALGKIDGINQWENLINGDMSQSRNELLVDLDPKYLYSAYIEGRYKLINNSYFDFEHSGDPGSTTLNHLDYYKMIKESIGNIYLEATAQHPLSLDKMEILRKRMQVQCNANTNHARVKACTGMCLFDLWKDPCEYFDISALKPSITRGIYKKIMYYASQAMYKPLDTFDPLADPKFCNNTWFNWLDETDRCWFDKLNRNVEENRLVI